MKQVRKILAVIISLAVVFYGNTCHELQNRDQGS